MLDLIYKNEGERFIVKSDFDRFVNYL